VLSNFLYSKLLTGVTVFRFLPHDALPSAVMLFVRPSVWLWRWCTLII